MDVIARMTVPGWFAQGVNPAAVLELLHHMMDVVVLDAVVLGRRWPVVAERLVVVRRAAPGVLLTPSPAIDTPL